MQHKIFQFKCDCVDHEKLRRNNITKGWGKKTYVHIKKFKLHSYFLDIGFQYRTINCTWGGNPCLGYTNEVEVQKRRCKITSAHFICFYTGTAFLQ